MSHALLWQPSAPVREQANLTHFMAWLKREKGRAFASYDELWSWSVLEVETFWEYLWDYFAIIHHGHYDRVCRGTMPETRWFDGTYLSYCEHVFRKGRPEQTAILATQEQGAVQCLTYGELRLRVAKLQRYLKTVGVKPGDRVAAYLPCAAEATVAFLAVNSLGAVWSSCSPDFGSQSVVDRFAQIEPVVLIAVDRYHYGGKTFSKTETVQSIVAQLPTVRHTIMVGEAGWPGTTPWNEIQQGADGELTFHRSGFNDPIWILFSSGTTGLPKALVHSTGGILLEHLKYLSFHQDVKPGELCFWYTTTGWMMWNYIQSSLLLGATAVLYDGSPAYPTLDHLWHLAHDQQWNHFGTSAGFILACLKAGIQPNATRAFPALRSLGSTGSTLPPEGFEWVYEHIKKDVWLTSMSGGTDVCSAFVGGNPLWPVRKGEIQCRALGCALEAWDDEGHARVGEVGEMVIVKPMPSMPIFFWGDVDFQRYRESYFETYPATWRHGDWIEITKQQGVIIYGRSDATLNRGGVRIGTSEVYRAVDKVSKKTETPIKKILMGKDPQKVINAGSLRNPEALTFFVHFYQTHPR
ncbi:MAG: acetoacetate--CoA ligase [Cyclobacteriaceae bacterium]|nr:acetoacetate--CoA ligase [Cyclobacteriaceae bacterium]